jgi:EAL domain-containing protein (putative c-di-GMP-specific phosphodiesterase class I)
MRANGVRLAVDDAGSGWASLSHILKLRPDIIKLDITLTRDIAVDPIKRALGASLVAFGQDIGSTLIAEGIETAEEQKALDQLGVSWGQGYYIARPGELVPA